MIIRKEYDICTGLMRLFKDEHRYTERRIHSYMCELGNVLKGKEFVFLDFYKDKHKKQEKYQKLLVDDIKNFNDFFIHYNDILKQKTNNKYKLQLSVIGCLRLSSNVSKSIKLLEQVSKFLSAANYNQILAEYQNLKEKVQSKMYSGRLSSHIKNIGIPESMGTSLLTIEVHDEYQNTTPTLNLSVSTSIVPDVLIVINNNNQSIIDVIAEKYAGMLFSVHESFYHLAINCVLQGLTTNEYCSYTNHTGNIKTIYNQVYYVSNISICSIETDTDDVFSVITDH